MSINLVTGQMQAAQKMGNLHIVCRINENGWKTPKKTIKMNLEEEAVICRYL